MDLQGALAELCVEVARELPRGGGGGSVGGGAASPRATLGSPPSRGACGVGQKRRLTTARRSLDTSSADSGGIDLGSGSESYVDWASRKYWYRPGSAQSLAWRPPGGLQGGLQEVEGRGSEKGGNHLDLPGEEQTS